MKIVKVERDHKVAQGVLEDETVRLAGPWREGPADRASFTLSSMTPIEISRLTSGGESMSLSSVSLAVPVDPLSKIICVGVNYRDHVQEIKQDEAANPMLFTRFLETLVPHWKPVIRPKASETFDFEGEIAVVIGKKGRHISTVDALGYVSGYSCFMDGSVREYQRHSVTAGKNFWRSGSMGPWIVTADEIGDTDIQLQTLLNGQVVQSSQASRMIFGIREIISYCSRVTWLSPGDVIATGTPGGVGSRRVPPLWMKPGDTITVRVERVGELTNPIESES